MWEDATVPNGGDRRRRKPQSCFLSVAGDSPLQGSFKPVYRKTSECSCSAAGNFQVTAPGVFSLFHLFIACDCGSLNFSWNCAFL